MSPTEDERLLLLEAAARLGDEEARRKLGPSAPPPLPESAVREWPNHLRAFGQDELLRATAAVIRSLLLPKWAQRRPDDSRPRRAVEAAELWLKKKTPNAVQHASVLAKACTTASRDSFGYEHRIAEAARAIANAPAAARGERLQDCLAEALEKAEEHINSELYVKALYGRERETRACIADALRSALLKT